MQKVIRGITLIFAFAIFLVFNVGCTSTENSKVISFDTIDYYKNNGYFEVEDNKYVKIETNTSNIVNINGTKLVKGNATITLHLNTATKDIMTIADNSSMSNINLSTGKILTGFEICNIFYEYDLIDNLNIRVNSDIKIIPKFLDFDIIGTFVYCNTAYNESLVTFENGDNNLSSICLIEENQIISNDEFLLLSYFDNCDFSSITKTNFKTNAMSNFKLIKEDNTYTLLVNIEIPIGTNLIQFGFITKDSDDNIKFIYYGESEINGNQPIVEKIEDLLETDESINKIIICAGENLSYNQNYLK